jgi:hypothetical protein
MNLKDIFKRLESRGEVDLSATFFSSKYPMSAVRRYFDPTTRNAIDVTATVGGKRLYRQTSRPETATMPASFEGSHWLEETT